MKELQRECRKLLEHEDMLRAKCRHELAIKRQNEERKQQQIRENKHIIARYVMHFMHWHWWMFIYVLRELSCHYTL